MGYALGVDFGTTKTTVAMVASTGGVGQSAAGQTVLAEAPSVVFLGDGDEIAIGQRAEHRGLPSPHLLIRDFKRRLGDSVPVVAGARSVSAETMAALLICELVRDAVAAAGAAPEALTVTYPGTWGPYKQDLLAKSLEEAGLPDFELVSEPAAAIRNALGVEPAHSTVVVYDLGGSSFDVSVMRRTALGEFETVGRPQQLEGVGGADFDQAVFSYVQQCAALTAQDVSDPEVLTALRSIRQACREAKEALSHDTETTIPVNTPQLQTRVRLVRSEFEELIVDAVEDTLSAMRGCINSAGLTDRDVDAIVLVGGSSQIPLVAQMISAEFELPLVNCERPGAAIALGAAQFAELADQPTPVNAGWAVHPASVVPANWAVHPVSVPAAGWAPSAAPIPAGWAARPAPAGWAADPVLPPWAQQSWHVDLAPHPASASAGEIAVPSAAPSAEPHPALAARQAGPAKVDQLESTVPQQRHHDESELVATSPAGPGATGPASDTEPGADQPRGGRHRIRGRRRYWVRTTGIVASVCGVLLFGSSVVGSKAAEPQPDSSQVQFGVGSASPPPTVRPASNPRTSEVGQPAATGSAGLPAAAAQPGDSVAAQKASPTSQAWVVPETGPAGVNAPAVVGVLAAQAGPLPSTDLSTAVGSGVSR